MAQRPGGSVLDEQPPVSRRERRTTSTGRGRHGGDRTESAPPRPLTRQARRAQAERHRFWFRIMPGIALSLAVVVLVGALIRSGDDGTTSNARPPGARATRGPGTVLLGHRTADGRLDLLVLTGARGRSASTLLLPVATQVEVPSLGLQTLADLPKDADDTVLRTTVENVLGVRVARTAILDDAALANLLATAAPIPVTLHRAVRFDEASGDAFAAGSQSLTAPDAARLLVTAQPGSELDRLVTVQDVMDGLLARLRRAGIARTTVRSAPGLAPLVAVARATDRRTDTLPVESVTTGGGERFEPRTRDIERYVPDAFPGVLVNGGRNRPRVEILNGVGSVGLAQEIANRIVPAGGKVTLTGNVNRFGVGNTQVVYYRDSGRAAAQRMLQALDCGALKKADRAIGVVDVTIVAGADCFGPGGP
jgi:hypothetical protein